MVFIPFLFPMLILFFNFVSFKWSLSTLLRGSHSKFSHPKSIHTTNNNTPTVTTLIKCFCNAPVHTANYWCDTKGPWTLTSGNISGAQWFLFSGVCMCAVTVGSVVNISLSSVQARTLLYMYKCLQESFKKRAVDEATVVPPLTNFLFLKHFMLLLVFVLILHGFFPSQQPKGKKKQKQH